MMNKTLFAVAVASLVAAASCTDSTTAPVPTPDSTAILEARTLALVKDHRESRGHVLYSSGLLSDQAREHSRAMADGARVLGHDGLPERLETLAAAGVYHDAAGTGEVVTYSSAADPAGAAVTGWLQSAEHRAILEHPAGTIAGVGAARAPGGRWFFTLLLLNPR